MEEEKTFKRRKKYSKWQVGGKVAKAEKEMIDLLDKPLDRAYQLKILLGVVTLFVIIDILTKDYLF